MRVTALKLAKRLREEQESLNRLAEQYFGALDDGHFAAVAMVERYTRLLVFLKLYLIKNEGGNLNGAGIYKF